MKNANPYIVGIVGALILIGADSALAQDWPQWRGANRDGKVTGFTAPGEWPGELKEQWKSIVGAGDATPALVGDKLYVFARQGEDEVTLCLDAAGGEELWQEKYPAMKVSGPAVSHAGPRSSPAVAEGKVVTLGVGGILSCLDAATGELVWRKDEFPDVVPAYYTAMSPIVVDGAAIAHLGGTDGGAIVALDLASGEPKWKWEGDGPAYSSPVLMNVDGVQQIVIMTDKKMVGLAVADGKLMWELEFEVQGRSVNCATPIVDGQTVIYTAQGRGTTAVRIEKQAGGFEVRELWKNERLSSGFCTPVLANDLLFGLLDRGSFFCMDARTGQEVWTDSDRRERFGAVVMAGSVIVALQSNSELIAFKSIADEYVELMRIKVADSPVYAHPVLAGNRIFIKDAEAVTMWTIE